MACRFFQPKTCLSTLHSTLPFIPWANMACKALTGLLPRRARGVGRGWSQTPVSNRRTLQPCASALGGRQDRGSEFPNSRSQPWKGASRGPRRLRSRAFAVRLWWPPVGAVLRVWSQAEVCKFITLTVPDPRIQITGQSHKIVSQSEASC